MITPCFAVAGPPYKPLDAQVIPRFAGIRTFMRAPHVTDLAGVETGLLIDTLQRVKAEFDNYRKRVLRVMREIDDRDEELYAIYHSHTATEARTTQ